MKLGAFSISLSVKDLNTSKTFYEKLGFTVFGGEEERNWLIMKNGDHVIGLFHGMFEGNPASERSSFANNLSQLRTASPPIRLSQQSISTPTNTT